MSDTRSFVLYPCVTQVCSTTVGVLGDLTRTVESDILPYCDDIMSVLITNLGREDVHRTIKPQILSAFGDIAMVIDDKFEKYLDAVLRVLKQAMSLSIDSTKMKGECGLVLAAGTLSVVLRH